VDSYADIKAQIASRRREHYAAMAVLKRQLAAARLSEMRATGMDPASYKGRQAVLIRPG
jgi:hypothetical protein